MEQKRIDNQLGLEKTPEIYVENTVKWAREVWRVLRPDGTFFLNLGDSYAGGGGSSGHWGGGNLPAPGHLKPKDLCEIPSDVVRALRKDGWWLRSRLPWVKRSAMPESTTDRPASALEYMFLLTKSSKCYFDMDAIRKSYNESSLSRYQYKFEGSTSPGRHQPDNKDLRYLDKTNYPQNPAGRNFRNTDLFYQSLEEPHGAIFCGDEMVGLDVNPQSFDIEMCENCQEVYFGKEYRKLKIHTEIKDGEKVESRICKICKLWDKWLSHFATFPEWLVTPLIKAGTSEKGACPECGAPWERVVEPQGKYADSLKKETWKSGGLESGNSKPAGYDRLSKDTKTIGWQPTCKCGHKETVPCVVLDPFGGSGTTKNVADRLGRRGVICELKMEYIEMARKRCRQEPNLF